MARNHRTGILQRVSSLSKRINRQGNAIVSFWMPLSFPDLKLNCQYAVAKYACRRVILVDYDWG
jgi:hypothetical protein